MIVVTRTVEVPYPVRAVQTVLPDPTEALGWNPHVKYFVPAGGDEPHLRSRFLAVERIGGLKLALEYRILHQEPGRALVIAGRNRLVEQTDILVLRQLEDSRTRITRQAQLTVRALGFPLKRWLASELPGFVEASTRAIAERIEQSLATLPAIGTRARNGRVSSARALLRR